MKKLSIIVTTRKRPHLLIPTLRTTIKNVRNPNTKIVVMVDDDDEATIGTIPQVERLGARVMAVPRPKSFGTKFNLGMESEPGDVYSAQVDYAPMITEGFDQKILDAATMYPDGYAVLMNWWANLSFPTLNAVTHKMVEKMGGIYPEYYPYWFIDHHLLDVARMIDRVVFVDVKVDRSERKETPTKVWTTNKRETWFWALLFDALIDERKEQARSIIESVDFDDTPARKKVLVNNFPWVAHHSSIVNSFARNDLGSDFTTDSWYEMVKANGVEKLRQVLSPELFTELGMTQAKIDKIVAERAA